MFKTSLLYIYISILIIFSIINKNLTIIVIPSLTSELIIILIIYFYKIRYSKYKLTFAIIECVFDIVFKIFLVICIRNEYSMTYCLSFGIIHLMINFASCRDQYKSVFMPHLMMTNIIYYLTALFVFLRIENMIKWTLYASYGRHIFF